MKAILLILALAPSIMHAQYDIPDKQEEKIGIGREALLRESICNCKHIPLFDYSEGMRFYFPKGKSDEDMRYKMDKYFLVTEARKNELKRRRINYSEVAGKEFIISKISDIRGGILGETYIDLKHTPSGFEIRYKCLTSRSYERKEYSNGSRDIGHFNLPGAVYLPEVDSMRAKYVNKVLYTNFLSNGVKFQAVKIIQIGVGVECFPIRIVYE